MQTRLPTLSSLSRHAVCRAAGVLPQADHISEAADGGTVMHTFLHRVGVLRSEGAEAEDAREAAAAEAPEAEQDFLLSIPVDFLPTDPSAFAGEVALAFDAATGKARELGRNIGRKYEEAALAQGKPLSPTEIVGSLDVVSLMGQDGVYVADWKRRGRYIAPARDNWQVKAGVLAACRAWGRTRAKGEIIRIFDDGCDPYRDPATFDAAAIDRVQVDLTMLAARILRDRQLAAKGEAIPATVSGHCRHCASFAFCPAMSAMARRLGGEPDQVKGELVALISRENAAEVRRRIVQARAVIDAAEEALDLLASQEAASGHPLETEPGVFYQPIPRPRESIDGAKAEGLIRAEFGEFAKEAISVDVTKAGIKAAIRKKTNGARGMTKVEQAFLEKLRKAGAIKKTVSYSCGEVRAKGPKQAALPAPAEPGKAA